MKAEDIELGEDYRDVITGLVGQVSVLVLSSRGVPVLLASFEVPGHAPELISLERLEPLTLN